MKRYHLPSEKTEGTFGKRRWENSKRERKRSDYVRYMIWSLIVLVTAIACFTAGTLAARPKVRQESAVPNTVYETETVTENQMVINQKDVEPVSAGPKEEFYLVSETGYLLVFAQDQTTICMHTHIPITEFPEKEQEKLREGIWFESMMDIFHYLESYTS